MWRMWRRMRGPFKCRFGRLLPGAPEEATNPRLAPAIITATTGALSGATKSSRSYVRPAPEPRSRPQKEGPFYMYTYIHTHTHTHIYIYPLSLTSLGNSSESDPFSECYVRSGQARGAGNWVCFFFLKCLHRTLGYKMYTFFFLRIVLDDHHHHGHHHGFRNEHKTMKWNPRIIGTWVLSVYEKPGLSWNLVF